jgi:hypothetical protein
MATGGTGAAAHGGTAGIMGTTAGGGWSEIPGTTIRARSIRIRCSSRNSSTPTRSHPRLPRYGIIARTRRAITPMSLSASIPGSRCRPTKAKSRDGLLPACTGLSPYSAVKLPLPVSGVRAGVRGKPGAHTGAWGHTAGRPRIASGILRGRNCPSLRSPPNFSSSTTILPRRIVIDGHAETSCPSHGV